MKLTIILVISTFLCALAAYGQQTTCGIGAMVLIVPRAEGDRLQIVGVHSNSPAARAGLAINQVIRAIDGVPTMNLKLSDCVRRIQGKAGTKIVFEVEDRRHGWTNAVEVTREIVPDDPLSVNADRFDVPQAQKPKKLKVTTNQVVRVVSTNGVITDIQFTDFGTTNAFYRWHSRPVPGGTVRSGTGVVFENYERHTDAYGGIQLTQLGSRDDLFVKAGSIRIQWSYNNTKEGWLYYYPSLGKVEILPSAVFDSPP